MKSLLLMIIFIISFKDGFSQNNGEWDYIGDYGNNQLYIANDTNKCEDTCYIWIKFSFLNPEHDSIQNKFIKLQMNKIRLDCINKQGFLITQINYYTDDGYSYKDDYKNLNLLKPLREEWINALFNICIK